MSREQPPSAVRRECGRAVILAARPAARPGRPAPLAAAFPQDTRRSRACVRFAPLVHHYPTLRVCCSRAPLSVPRGGGVSRERSVAVSTPGWCANGTASRLVPGSGRATGPALVERYAMERVCATAARDSAGPPPGAGRPTGWRGARAGPGIRASACCIPSRPAATAGFIPAARMAASARPYTGIAPSSAPCTAAAKEPQGP